MKKKGLYFCAVASFCLFSAQQATAQTESVGIGTSTPSNSAILDVTSSNKGVLIPRMTQGQRDAIGGPVTGLLIYQTDGGAGFYYYSGSSWQQLGAGGNGSGANRSLSNLETGTAVNANLLPSGSGVWSLGAGTNGWRDLYLTSNIHFQGNRTIGVYGTNNFFGTSAGNPNIAGDNNVAVGPFTLSNFTSGFWNTGVGYQALANSTSNYSNTAMGYQSLYAISTGSRNTAIGVLALQNNSSGSLNTAIGESAGFDLLNGNNNTYLGALANSPIGSQISNATAVGYGATVATSNTMRFGNNEVGSIGGFVNWTALSDGRFKYGVQENVPGLDFIKQLRPVTYQLAIDEISRELEEKRGDKKRPTPNGIDATQLESDVQKNMESRSTRYSGFIAQEVEAAANKLGYRFSGVDAPKNNDDFYGLRYAEFVVPLVKAVQELNQQLELAKRENELNKKDKQNAADKLSAQEKQLSQQQAEINTLKQMMIDLQNQLNALKAEKR